MKNANQPAMPMFTDRGVFEVNGGKAFGLTKREHFAAMAMQGILANQYNVPVREDQFDLVSKWSVMAVDSLLKELDK